MTSYKFESWTKNGILNSHAPRFDGGGAVSPIMVISVATHLSQDSY